MTFLSTRTWQYTYFAKQLGEPVWRGKDVLDFGGNIGNMLRDPNSTVDVGRYWCIDIDEEALRIGRRRYPEAHWLHYDRYCFFFNPRGVPHLKLPRIEQRFDYIVAYSVFTNTPTTDMLELVATPRELRDIAGDPLRGKLLFAAKEAVYKAAYPLDRVFLEFRDIEIDLAARRAITRTGRALALRYFVSSHIVALALPEADQA